MKKITYFITITLSAAVLSLSSCLKDSRYVDFSAVGTLVELPLAAYNGVGVLTPAALPISATPQTISVVVNVASPKPLSTALTVKLAVDASALTAYNTANGTSFVMLPTADYSIPSLTVTIPANQRTATLNIQVNTSLVDPAGQFLLPISIVDGGGQKISNYSTILYNVQAKNKYDGEYTVTGTMVDVTNGNFTGDYPLDIYLETTGANTDAWYDPNNGFAHIFFNAGAVSAYGTFSPVFTFDVSTNKVTAVTSHYINPPNGRSARIDPSGANAFTGTPGTAGAELNVKYIMVQPSAGGDRTFFTEKFVYKGPRP